ncbi:MAG TPA: hypothetical protein VHB20_15350 [Verrucomicrobiae bacterium]|jgi:hypothetical protein|nr:hypothetical protein [Verrucomicrobiae bacterium]
MKAFSCLVRGLIAGGILLLAAANARANVYATDLKLNGSATQASISVGNGALIGYILSDDATLGVSINILSNNTPVRVITVPTNALATRGTGVSLGTNLVFWDGKDDEGAAVGFGNFTFKVMAASAGHADWTLLTTNAIKTTNASGDYYAYAPRGIAVDNDSNSLSYGRVFVGNAATGFKPGSIAGDNDTILKFNADGSAADDGAFGDGGYPIADYNDRLPEKLRMGDDGRLYMNDRTSQGQTVAGEIVAFDKELTTNEVVLSQNNYQDNPFFFSLELDDNGAGWFAMDVTTGGTNGQVWLGGYSAGGAGGWFWNLVNGMADPTDDIGQWAIYAGAGGSLSLDASGGLMVDKRTNVFVSQYVDGAGAPDNRCMMFTNVAGVAPETNAFWAVGAGDDTFQDVFDTTIDSRSQPHYVACAMSGPNVGGLRILSATNGATLAANLDPANTYFATAWDNVGNLYAACDSLHGWRVWSPPSGPNSSTTIGQTVLKTVDSLTILNVTDKANVITVTFTAPSTNALSNFKLYGSSDVVENYAAEPASFTNGAVAGVFIATTTNTSPVQFYRIKR